MTDPVPFFPSRAHSAKVAAELLGQEIAAAERGGLAAEALDHLRRVHAHLLTTAEAGGGPTKTLTLEAIAGDAFP